MTHPLLTGQYYGAYALMSRSYIGWVEYRGTFMLFPAYTAI